MSGCMNVHNESISDRNRQYEMSRDVDKVQASFHTFSYVTAITINVFQSLSQVKCITQRGETPLIVLMSPAAATTI